MSSHGNVYPTNPGSANPPATTASDLSSYTQQTSTYLYVSSFNIANPNKPYTFKTDAERMNFLLGRLNTSGGRKLAGNY
jgi:hypothetical protein